jgi:Fur family transcriptional regulator, ferric uptake regulator
MLLPDAVTRMCATGAPLLVTVPLKNALALTAYAGAPHKRATSTAVKTATDERRTDEFTPPRSIAMRIDNRVSLSNSQAPLAWKATAPGKGEEHGVKRTSVSERGRKTKQRDALTEILQRSDRPLSVDELLEAASKRVDGLGVATVYRTVNALLENGWIEAVEIPGEPTRYERSDRGHHHHFQCERCDRVFDIAGCLDNVRKLAPPKFRVRDHAVTLYGVCASCAV